MGTIFSKRKWHSSSDQDSQSIFTDEEIYHFKYSLLILNIGRDALQTHFETIIPVARLSNEIKRQKKNFKQWQCSKKEIETLTDVGKGKTPSSDMDITLLYKLIRNMSPKQSNTKAWGYVPKAGDISKQDDVERIRHARNLFTHGITTKLQKAEFQQKWEEVSKAIDRLSRGKLAKDINDLKNKTIGMTDAKAIEEKIKELKDKEEELEKECNQLREDVNDIQKDMAIEKQKTEELSKISPSNKDIQRETVKIWRLQDSVYYRTRCFQSLWSTLKSYKYLTVIGGPGSGKTAAIRHVALELQNEGFDIIPIDDIKGIINCGHQSHKRVFLIDDVLGKFGLQIEKYNQIIECINEIDDILSSTSKLLMTCRRSVYNEAHVENCRIMPLLYVIDLDSEKNQLTGDDKKEILKRHCLEANVELRYYNTLTFDFPTIMFPFLCKLFAKDSTFYKKGVSFFKCPNKYIEFEIDMMKSRNPLQYAVLVMCVLNKNKLSEVILKSKCADINRLKTNVLKWCRVETNTDNWRIINALQQQEGTYTTNLDNEFSLIHDFIFEVIACHFGRDHPEQVLEYMSSGFLCKKISVGEQTINSEELTIKIPESSYTVLAQRLHTDIDNMNLHDVFMARCLFNREFLKEFLNYMDKMTYREFKSLFLRQRQDPNQIDNLRRESIGRKNMMSLETIRQNILVDKRYEQKGCMTYNMRVVSWVVLYGHKTILRYIINRVSKSNNPIKHIFGSCQEEQTRLLVLGCFSGDLELVNSIINHVDNKCLTATPEYKNDDMNGSMYSTFRDISPLIAACLGGFQDIISLLQQKGCDIRSSGNTYLTPLMAASLGGDIETVIMLTDQGCNIHTIASDGVTPLMFGCMSGSVPVVHHLIKHKVDINAYENDEHVSAIHIASLHGLGMVNLLVSYGANINLCTKSNITPLFLASYKGNDEMVRELIKQNAKVNICNTDNVSPLFIASQLGYCSVVSLLIQNKAVVNLCENIDKISPLYRASQMGNFEISELLLTNGAHVNMCDINGKSPLYIASENGHYDMALFLISYGADVNLCDEHNLSPLFKSSQNGQNSIANLLIAHGANVNLCSEDNISPLYIALHEGHFYIASLLIKHQTNVNLCNRKNISPLYITAANGNYNEASILITSGADVNLCDDDSKSPLYKATQKGHINVVELLIREGANVNMCDKDNISPLHVASLKGDCHVVHLLIKGGADVNMCDRNNRTPLYMAAEKGHFNVVWKLIKNDADVDLCAKDNLSPLAVSLQNGHSEVNFLLLQRTCNIDGNDVSQPKRRRICKQK